MDLLLRGQANRAPFAPYHAELHKAGVVSQILPTAGSVIWIELQLAFTAPQPQNVRSR
jgi:hypothetical protein